MAHFSYAPVDKTALFQGDVLGRTEGLDALIRQVHPHFARQDNLYFLVLTQSCDLVPGRIKTDYIAICPVRTLASVLRKALPAHIQKSVAGVPVGIEKEKARYRQFLERLFNNNEPSLFFLESKDTQLGEDFCALTKLAISLKNEHYRLCLDAKVLQLSESFQAKLGWLIGSNFSRVGTQDYEERELKRKVDSAMSGSTVWLPSDRERKALLEAAAGRAGGVAPEDIPEILKSIPAPKEKALRVVDRAMDQVGIDAATKGRLIKQLANDPELAQIFAR